MSVPAIVVTNLLDTATLSTSGANVGNPVTYLQNEHPSVRWVVNGTSAYFVADLGSVKSVDVLAVINASGSNPTFRARFSVADATGVTTSGGGYDSGSLTGLPYFDHDYGKFVYPLSSPVSVRYVRYDVTEAATVSQAAGRGCIGLRALFSNGAQAVTRTAIRRSVLTHGTGKSTFVDRRQGNWSQKVSFGFLTETERTTFVEAIGVKIVNIGHADFLWLLDPASSNLSRDTLWGFHEPDELATTHSRFTYPQTFNLELQIEDRG